MSAHNQDARQAMRITGWIVAIVALDQAVKHAVWSRFRWGEALPVLSACFQLRYIRNQGAAWGILQGQRWPLIAISIGMLALLHRHRNALAESGRLERSALALLTGGILGNLIDRLRFGYVVDFLDFHWNGWHFPAFNIADAAICLGVALYLGASIVAQRAQQGGQASTGPAPQA